ncbi:MAG TPA: hypothetical protein VEZ50_15935 [Nodosilinea sp.]|nr:hypothetical protein [Nodosilinea sp.]
MYQRYWVVTESLVPRIFGGRWLNDAIAEFNYLKERHYHPRLLGETEADTLSEIKPLPAIDPTLPQSTPRSDRTQ